MGDDEFDFFLDEDLPYEALLELEQPDAQQKVQQEDAAPQRQILVPQRPSLKRHSTSATSNGTRSTFHDPSRHLRPPLSFGDTDFQELDAGVLEDGMGMDSVGEENTTLHKQQQQQQPHDQIEAEEEYGNVEEMHDVQPRTGSLAVEDPTVEISATERYKIDHDMECDYVDNSFNANAKQMAEMEEAKERLEQLTREREQSLQDLAAAKAFAEAKAGEIAIIRSNQAKLETSHNQQLSALRNALNEEARKYKAEMEAVVMESKRLTTENVFLKQDLKEEAYRASKLQLDLKSKAKDDDQQGPRTPRKSRTLPLRDGFEDDEIMASPSKTAGRRSKRGTPTTSGKRKRGVDDSPIPAPLELSQSFESNTVGIPEQPKSQEPELQIPQKEDNNARFMRRIFNHRSHPRTARDIEVLSSLSFPCDRSKTLSSIILEHTATRASDNYALDYAKAIISLWSRALAEKYHKPIGLFMSIIKFIISLDPTEFTPPLIESLVPVLQDSGCVNGVPRFTSSPVSHKNLGQIKQTQQKDLDHRVSSTAALEMLYLTITSCLHNPEARRLFWRCVGYDFILMMLNPYQQLKDIILVLKTLSCSFFPDTFGPIDATESRQRAYERYIIDRAANLLSETFSVDEGEKPYTRWEICTLRVEVMSFLIEIAFSSPNPSQSRIGKMIAVHPTALARIFRSMHDELDALYSNPPERDLHATLVNGLTRLVHGILTSFPGQVDLPTKLRGVSGATQKHLVVLTRLAFSEGPLLEAGITDDSIEMAHEMLEDVVNPQEAEALLEVFVPRSER